MGSHHEWCGGENIYPGEIEQAVYPLPQVKENVVFGVPDGAMGEELALVLHKLKAREAFLAEA